MRRLDHALVGLVALPYAWMAAHFRWLCDDAYISFRYARNWATGAGLRFNPGSEPPVEGYSNFLWTAWCAALEWAGLDVSTWASLTSFACGLALLWGVYRSLRECGASRPACTVGVAALGWAPPFVIWSTGGLETLPFALLLFVTLDRLVLRRAGPAPRAAAAAGLGVALLRTEGILWVLFLAGLTVANRGDRPALRPVARFLGLVLLPYAVYWSLRFAYYGEPFSNTTYAKMGLPTDALFRGARYVASYFAALVTPLAILPAAALAIRWGPRREALGLGAVALAGAGYGVLTGGDFMTMFRFLVPTLVVANAVLLGLGVHALATRHPRLRAWAFGTAALLPVAGMAPLFGLHVAPEALREALHFRGRFAFAPERTYWEDTRCNALRWAEYGRLLAERTGPGDSIVLGPAGAMGYHADRFVYDLYGIVTPEVAHREASGLWAPGHDKRVTAGFFLDRDPTIVRVEGSSRTAAEVRSLARLFATQDFADRYVIDWAPLDPDAAALCDHDQRRDGQRVYLVYVRRLAPSESAAAAWARVPEAALGLR